jgi:tetratricopeptide (TPR) repeat protein
VLLDRKKIRRWAKWVYLALIIVFLAGFLLLGIGYGGGGGFDITQIFNGGCDNSTTATTTVSNSAVQKFLDTLKTDPTNTEAMLGIAAYYEGLFDDSQKSNTSLANSAITYLKQALAADPTLKAVYLDLAGLYIDLAESTGTTSYYSDATAILNKATVVDPNNPEVYFALGKAQKALGNDGEAILAWQKFIELSPTDDRRAATIRGLLEQMMTTTTVAPATTTTTVAAGTTTTAASTTTTLK